MCLIVFEQLLVQSGQYLVFAAVVSDSSCSRQQISGLFQVARVVKADELGHDAHKFFVEVVMLT